MGLAVPALAAHAEPHWPTLLSMQLALCAVFVSTTVWSASRWETDATLAVTSADAATPATSAADGGSDGDDGGDDDAGMTFASQMRLCYYLTLPILLSLGGVYLVLRARLVAFAQHHALVSDDKRKGDGCDDEPPATATITISTTATSTATAAAVAVTYRLDHHPPHRHHRRHCCPRRRRARRRPGRHPRWGGRCRCQRRRAVAPWLLRGGDRGSGAACGAAAARRVRAPLPVVVVVGRASRRDAPLVRLSLDCSRARRLLCRLHP